MAEGNSHNQRSSCKTKESAPPLQMLEREKRRLERLASFVRPSVCRTCSKWSSPAAVGVHDEARNRCQLWYTHMTNLIIHWS